MDPQPGAPHSFQEWIERLTVGDPETVREFIAEYGPRMAAAIRACLSKRARRAGDTEDSLQIVFFKLITGGLETCRFDEPENLLGFVTTLARHEAIAANRRAERLKRCPYQELHGMIALSGAVSREPAPDAALAVADTWQLIFAQVSGRERDLLLLKKLGRSNSEIAGVLNVHERTIRKDLAAIQMKLGPLYVEVFNE